LLGNGRCRYGRQSSRSDSLKLLLALSVFSCRRGAQWRCCHVLLGSVGSVSGIGGVLHEHGMMALGGVGMRNWWWWAVEDMSLWVILGLCIHYARIEIRVLWIVGV
jgi:hypothetical protein